MIGIAIDNAESSLPDDNDDDDDDDDAANVLLLVELPPPSPPLPPVPPAPPVPLPVPLPAARTESGDGPFSLPRRRLTRWCCWLGGDARPAPMPSASPPRLRVVFPAPPPPPRLTDDDDEDEEGNDDDDDGDGDGDGDAAITEDAVRPLLLTPPRRRWPPPGRPRPETVTTAPTPPPPPNSSSAIPPMCAPPLLSPPPSLSPPSVSWPRNGPIAPAIDFLLPALLPAPSFARLDLGAREDGRERGGAPDFRPPPRCLCPIPPRRNSSLYPPAGGTDAAAADAKGILSMLPHAPAPVSAPITAPVATPVATPSKPPAPPMEALLDIISRLPKSRMTCVAGEGLVGMPCMPGMVVPLCMAVVDGGCIVGCADAPPKVPKPPCVVVVGVFSAADARPDVATVGAPVNPETH